MQCEPPRKTKGPFRSLDQHYKYYKIKLLTPIEIYDLIGFDLDSHKTFCLQNNSSNKGLITFQKQYTFVKRIMRFFVKKSQKDKKSGLYLSDFYTLYTYQKQENLTPF